MLKIHLLAMLGHGNFFHNIQPLIGGKKFLRTFFLKFFLLTLPHDLEQQKKIFFEPKQNIFLSELLIIEWNF